MSDLASLMEIAPNSAAFMVGQNNQSGLMEQQLKRTQMQQMMQQAQQEMQMKQAAQPGQLDHQNLLNQNLRLGQPGITADIETKTLANKKAAGTLDTDITSTNEENNAKKIKAQADTYKNVSKLLGGMAPMIENVPDVPGARLARVASELNASGLPPDHPVFKGMMAGFSKVPSKDLSKELTKFSDSMSRQADHYVQAMDVAKEQGEKARDVANIHAQATRDAASISANARIAVGGRAGKVAVTLDQFIDKAPNARARHAALIDAATKAKQAGEDELATNYMMRAEAVRPQAEAEIKSATPGSPNAAAMAGIPVQAGPSIAPPSAPTAKPLGQAGAAQIPQPKSLAQLAQMYPGKDPRELAARYKKQYGVDLK